MISSNITSDEIAKVLYYFVKLGYKPDSDSKQKLIELADDYPDRDFVKGAKEMYEWFSETKRHGKKIRSYHLAFRNWMKRDYSPKKIIVEKIKTIPNEKFNTEQIKKNRQTILDIKDNLIKKGIIKKI